LKDKENFMKGIDNEQRRKNAEFLRRIEKGSPTLIPANEKTAEAEERDREREQRG
jgi:hypothetical protein